IISAPPTVASAGPDQNLCNVSSSSFSGNTPSTGTGVWTLIAGTGTIASPNSPTSAVSGLSVGTNTFQWTISNGSCPPSTDQVSIIISAPPTVASAGPDQNLCNVSSSAFSGNTPSTGTGVWTLVAGSGFITTPSSATSNVTGLGFGTNTFVWTISNGSCPNSTDTVRISVYALPTLASAGPDQNLCNQFASVLAGNAPTTGTGLWTVLAGGATLTTASSPTSAVTGLTFGINTFQWTISNGSCPATSDVVNIFVDPQPTPAFAGSDQALCNITSTNLTGNTPVTGTGIWTLIAGSGLITNATWPTTGITGLGFGTNTFVWTISSGICPASTDTVHIVVSQLPTVADAGPDQALCNVMNSALAGNTPVTGMGTWTLVSGTGTITLPNSSTSSVTGLSVGVNIFAWTIQSGSCPASSDTVQLVVSALPTIAAAGPDQFLCNVTSSSFSGNSPLTGTGVWTLIAGTGTITTPSSPASTVTGLSVGTNTFQWTISNGSCPPSIDSVTVEVYDLPSNALAGPDQSICIDSVLLSGSVVQVGTGTWTLIAGSGTIINPNSSTTWVTGMGLGTNIFEWMISNGTCPPSKDTVQITVNPAPTAPNAGADQGLCNIFSTSFAGNTPLVGTGLWALVSGSGTPASPGSETSPVSGLGIGVNQFTWTITIGNCSLTDTMNIIVYDLPTVSNAGPDQNVCFDSAVFSGNTPLVGTGLWTLVSGTGVVANPTSPSSAVSGLSIGPNVFTWTISNGNCPSSTDTIILTGLPPTTLADAGPDQSLCNTFSSVFTGNTPIVGAGTWSLVNGSGVIASPSSETSAVSGLSIGTNTFVWTIVNGTCPPTTDTMHIVVYALPSPSNAGPDQSICTDSSGLTGNTPAIGIGMWSVVMGTGTIQSPAQAFTDFVNIGLGANACVWTISNGVCPANTDTVIIVVSALPTPAFAGADQVICSDTAFLNANPVLVGTGSWTLVSGTGIFADTAAENTLVSGISVGMNVFEWTTTNGTCPVSTDQVTITVMQTPTLADAGPDQVLYVPIAIMNGNVPIIGTGSWSVVSGTATITNPLDPNTMVTDLPTGTHVLQWSVSNSPCADSYDYVILEVKEYQIPNGFSPNNDGLNDEFTVPGAEIFDNVKLKVFNRWGGLVYWSDDYKNTWKGENMEGELLIDDTYYYLIEISGYENFQGYVVIKRTQ
ncbi:MAG: gliding motility-associated C-terminal domain-containing protein, partial [Bacteroidia bacterium]|nr:gliding motility-associated C-terminal domain-containing protein [Bacteroidia bacterium]